MPKPKVCIIYGLAEGPKIAKRLIKSLTEQGFGLTNNPETADALIVHSGGQYFLPPQIQSKIVLLAGPCNGYIRESRFLTQMQKAFIDLGRSAKNRQLAWWLYKSFWNTIYLFSNHDKHKIMLQSIRRHQRKLPPIRAKKAAVILYKNDPWSWHMDKSELTSAQKSALISHPGGHDDLWANPAEYVSVLKYLYEA